MDIPAVNVGLGKIQGFQSLQSLLALVPVIHWREITCQGHCILVSHESTENQMQFPSVKPKTAAKPGAVVGRGHRGRV